jgi:hypothetical protein
VRHAWLPASRVGIQTMHPPTHSTASAGARGLLVVEPAPSKRLASVGPQPDCAFALGASAHWSVRVASFRAASHRRPRTVVHLSGTRGLLQPERHGTPERGHHVRQCGQQGSLRGVHQAAGDRHRYAHMANRATQTGCVRR